MVIDFHTHIFPEAIAAKTIQYLQQAGNITAYTTGTLTALKSSMSEAGITTSVVLPVVTKPSQFHTINEYAASINGKDGILSFGGIHPDSEDYQAQLQTIHSLGLRGIKLHPDYQGVFIDDTRYLDIITYALSLDLAVVIHAGIDIGFPAPVHCPPSRARHMLDSVLSTTSNPFPKIVLAHTGGYGQWDEVEQFLVGEDVYFDLSFSLGKISNDQLIRIVHNHGSKKILFATDSPWGGQKETLELFEKAGFNKKEKEDILYKNACKLLNI